MGTAARGSTSTPAHPVESGDAATLFAQAHGYRQTLLDLRQDLVLPVREERLDRLAPDLDPTAYLLETSVDRLPEEWLEDRALLARRMTSVRTWNAETNGPMLAVNDRLGFTVTGWTREWSKDL